MQTTEEDRLMTVAEACVRLHVSRPTVYALIHDGELTKLKVRRSVRLRAAEVDAYLRRCEQRPDAA